MELIIKMDELEGNIIEAVNINVEHVVEDTVKKSVKIEVEKQTKSIIEEIVGNKIQEYVLQYINETTFKIGGGWNDDRPSEELTVSQLIKKEIKEGMENKSFKVKNNDGYGSRMKEVSFEDFIKGHLDFSKEVQEQLTKFMQEVRTDVNLRIKNQFNETTKAMLSDTMINLLSSNEVFTKIQNNIQSIANRE